jgi:leucyl aminopeptidase
MKVQSAVALALSVSTALALSISNRGIDVPAVASEQLFTLEIKPGETKQVTEAKKWELFNVGKKRQTKHRHC